MLTMMTYVTRCSAVAERPRCRVRNSFGQKWKTGTGTILYGQYRSILLYNRPKNMSNSVEKRKIRAIMAFKVIQGHWDPYQSKAVCILNISA